MSMPDFLKTSMGESIASLPPDARALVAFGAGLRELSQLFGVKRAAGAEPSATALMEGSLGPIDALMLLARLQGGAGPGAPTLPMPGPAGPPSPLPGLPQPGIPSGVPPGTPPGPGADPRALALQRLLMGARGIV